MAKRYIPGKKPSVFVKAMAEGSFLKNVFLKIRKSIDRGIAAVARRFISSGTEVEPKKVVFMHYANQYQCNPAYICDEILRRGLDWDLVYVLDQKGATRLPLPCPEGVRVVVRNSIEHFYEMASAKFWIDNAVCFPWEYVPKKKNQIYIDTWHGSMGLKRIDSDKIVQKKWAKAAKIAGKITNYMISNSSFETDVYRSTYWKDTKIQIFEYGHPRNDILFCGEERKREIRQKLYQLYDLTDADENTTKFVLYAPTFRDAKNIDCYDIDYDMLLDALRQRFGGEWYILNRYHFKVAKALENVQAIKNNPYVLNGNLYSDIQEIMAVCDAGITDYSSWICDFVLTGKPGFIYANDLKEYDSERGFYYPLDSTPFPIAENNRELYENILNFDQELYDRKKEKFLLDRGCKENGTAAKQVVDLMEQLIG